QPDLHPGARRPVRAGYRRPTDGLPGRETGCPATLMPAAVTESTGDYDRLGFTLCLALAVHALVVFGIGFTRPVPAPQPARLEVTLAKYHSERRPEKADFIAASHQQASGTEAAVVNPS